MLRCMAPGPGHRNLRKGRVSIPGQIYFVTTTTRGRKPIFRDWVAATATCRTLAHPDTWGDATLLCWVLMPDHWHGLVQLGDRDALALAVNRFKARITKAVHGCGVAGAVWARAYHDHALRADEDVRAAARYIVANPMRAGIVIHACDYPFWGAVWM